MDSGPLIYSGRASISLARGVRDELGVQLGSLRIRKFADSEPWYRVEDYKRIPGRNVYIIQSTSEYAPTSYFDLFGIMNAVKRQRPKRLVVIMTFMGFRRQERDVEGGEAVMAEQMARFIIEAGATDVVLCDPHAPELIKYFSRINVRVIDTNPLFVEALGGVDLSEYDVLTPDMGREKVANKFAELLELPLIVVEKGRPGYDEAKCKGVLRGIEHLKNKNIIIREDEVSTAGTAIKTIETIIEVGALKVIIMATHAVLVGDSVWNVCRSPHIEKLYVTNSIYLPWEKREDQIVVLSLAPAVAQIIKEIEAE